MKEKTYEKILLFYFSLFLLVRPLYLSNFVVITADKAAKEKQITINTVEQTRSD